MTCVTGSRDLCSACSGSLVPSTDRTKCVSCPNTTACTSCMADSICGVCAAEVAFNFGYCLACEVDNCLLCTVTENRCTACFEGYQLTATNIALNDQCNVCNNPCATCNADGTCRTCVTPYDLLGTSCILCDDPRCTSCSDNGNTSCLTCTTGWFQSGGVCVKCITGCTSCSDANTCTSCSTTFYFLANNTCNLCPDALKCKTCTHSSTT